MKNGQQRIAKVLCVLLDGAFMVGADLLGLAVRFELLVPAESLAACARSWVVTVPFRLLVLGLFGMYQRLWRYASVRDLGAVAFGVSFGYLGSLTLASFVPQMAWPRGAMLVSYLLAMGFVGLSRFYLRIKVELARMLRRPDRSEANAIGIIGSPTRVLIVGAGSAGVMVAKEIAAHPEMGKVALGYVDDDPSKAGGIVMGLPVLGSGKDIPRIVEAKRIDEVIIAMPSVGGQAVREVLDTCRQLNVKIQTLPGMYEIVDGKVSLKQLRDIQIEDLLGREPVRMDMQEIGAYLAGRKVLITGAGGSIGSEICRQVALFEPKCIVLLGHGENSIFEIQNDLTRRFPTLTTHAVIADVRDAERIGKVFQKYRPDVVFHAAAHKHVPLMEANPEEALTNNVFGTRNVAQAADKYKVRRFVMISTDKAVNPVSIMGMSKRIAEMVVQAVGAESSTKFMAVRFGNVLGSRGSVVPLFRKQIADGGPVTVTHPDMTRYFMTIPEAVQLVIQAGAMGEGGEVFVLDMGEPVKIVDLAEEIIRLSGYEPGRDIEVVYTGIRPGEKLFEEILTSDEAAIATRHKKIFVSQEDQPDSEMFLRAICDVEDSYRAMGQREIAKKLEELVHTEWQDDAMTAAAVGREEILRAGAEAAVGVAGQ
jgi:FlaA1/EpsC-like NDP-sugar epimerase